jgi:hypothetical protein
MANGDNIDPKKQEELNARKQEGANIDRERNDLGKDFLDLLEKVTEQQSESNRTIGEYLSSQRDITTSLQMQMRAVDDIRTKQDLKSTLNLSRQVTLAIQNSLGPYNDIATIQKARLKNQGLLNKLELDYKALLAGTKEEQEDLRQELLEILNHEDKGKELAIQSKNITKEKLQLEQALKEAQKIGNQEVLDSLNDQLNNVNEREAILQADISLHADKSKTLKDITTEEAKQSLHILNTVKNLEGANQKLQEQLDIQLAVNNAMGLSGAVLKGINKALGGALGSTGELLKNTEERIKKLVEERSHYDENGKLIAGNVSKLRGFGIAVNEVGKSIISNLTDPLVLIGSILAFSDQTTQLQRSLSLTEGQAENLKNQFRETAVAINDAAINAMTIQNAAMGINDALGGFAFTFDSPDMQQMVGEAAKFQEKMGASNEEMTGIVQSSLATGKGFEELQLGILEVTGELENQTGIRLNEAKLMKEAASVTGEIRAQLGGSVVEIGKAIAVAKSFGMELKDVAATADSLLNFEQSINAELEAELLTGKQINLERARLAALTGDYQTLTEEINKNVGDFNDFSNMNVLQQRAMAEAFGMTSDQLSDILFKEGSIEEMKQKAIAAGNEETLKMLEQRTLQQDFEDSMNKVKQVFVDIVGGPGGELLKMIAGIAKTIANIAETGLGGMVIRVAILAKLFGGPIMTAFKTIKGISNFLKANTIAINAAERVGLIRKQQAVNARVRENLLQKEGVTTEKLSNFHKNAGLLTTLKRNLAEKIGNVRKKIGLGIEKTRNFFSNLNLLTKIKEGAVTLGNNIKRGIGLGIDKARLVIQNLLNSKIILQGILMMKNIAKAGIELAMRAAMAVATAAGRAFAALGGIPVVGPALAVAAAAAAAALIYRLARPKKTGDFMSKGRNISESVTPGGLNNNEGLISVGGKTRTFDTNIDEVNISPTAVTGATPVQTQMKTPPSTIIPKQDNSDVIAAINALGEKPGMKETKVDTLPAPTDLFTQNTKIGKSTYQQNNRGQVLFT